MNNQVIMDILKHYGMLGMEANVVRAERAFTASSAIKWCLAQRDQGIFSEHHVETYFLYIHKYMKGQLDLLWDDGILSVDLTASALNKQSKNSKIK